MTSCPFEGEVKPHHGMVGLMSETLGLRRPQKLPYVPTKSSSCQKHKWMTSRIHMMTLGAFKGQRHGGRERPPRSRPAKVSLVEHPPFSPVQASGIPPPLVGVTTPIWWDFIPMEVRTNHLPICTCLLGRVLQQKQVHPPWDHNSYGL
jgi:hypothetical protein